MVNIFVILFVVVVQAFFFWVSYKLTRMTPLEFWKHPNMWAIASFSAVGMSTTIGSLLTTFFPAN